MKTRSPFYRFSIKAAAALALAGLLTGCAGYRLGSMLPRDIHTVYVPTAVNNTTEPLIETETTRAMIETLQRDGSLKVVNEGGEDAVLKVTLNNYEIVPLAFDQSTRTLAEEYRIIINATVVLERSNGDQVVSTNVRGKNTFPFQSDLTSAKRTALPLAAQDLAHNIVEAVVEYW